MSNRWEVKWWRVGAALACIFGVIILIAFVAEYWWMPWQVEQEFVRENPHLGVVPAPLTDTSIAKLEGARVAIAGLSMQVPWKEIKSQAPLGSGSYIGFESGESILSVDWGLSADLMKKVCEEARTPKQWNAMKDEFGSPLLNCCYAEFSADLAATPADLHWWDLAVGNRRMFRPLIRKSLELVDAGAIYPISAGDVRGYQFGDPSRAPYQVKLVVFDRDDQRHELNFGRYPEDHPFLTQAQVNAIVASIRPIPHS